MYLTKCYNVFEAMRIGVWDSECDCHPVGESWRQEFSDWHDREDYYTENYSTLRNAFLYPDTRSGTPHHVGMRMNNASRSGEKQEYESDSKSYCTLWLTGVL